MGHSARRVSLRSVSSPATPFAGFLDLILRPSLVKGEIVAIVGQYRRLQQALNSLKADLNINDLAKDLKSQSEGGEKATAAYAILSDTPDEKAGIYINSSVFEPLNELRRTGILLHEMCHFYLQMAEDRAPRDPRKLTITQKAYR